LDARLKRLRAEAKTAVYVAAMADARLIPWLIAFDRLLRLPSPRSTVGSVSCSLRETAAPQPKQCAKTVGLDEVRAEVLPGDRLRRSAPRGERPPSRHGGDGVNDAPALRLRPLELRSVRERMSRSRRLA